MNTNGIHRFHNQPEKMRDPRLKKEDFMCVCPKEKKTKILSQKEKRAMVIMNNVLQYVIHLKKPGEFHAFIKEKLMLIRFSLACWEDT